MSAILLLPLLRHRLNRERRRNAAPATGGTEVKYRQACATKRSTTLWSIAASRCRRSIAAATATLRPQETLLSSREVGKLSLDRQKAGGERELRGPSPVRSVNRDRGRGEDAVSSSGCERREQKETSGVRRKRVTEPSRQCQKVERRER